MKKRTIYWLVLGAFVLALVILIAMQPNYNSTLLTIENKDGELSEVSIDDIYTTKGIDFESLNSIDDVSAEYTISVLQSFYEKYSEDKGSSLIRVYFLDQIMQKSPLRDLTYKQVTFQSADGAQVLIQPSEYRDNLILITLEKDKGKYSLRLIMPEDTFSQRWLKNVVKITLG